LRREGWPSQVETYLVLLAWPGIEPPGGDAGVLLEKRRLA
jgi:hypothetical protein